MTRKDNEHPLDEALGDIHEIAIMIEMLGQHGLAIKLAEAHEKISMYLFEQMLAASESTTDNSGGKTLEEIIEENRPR